MIKHPIQLTITGYEVMIENRDYGIMMANLGFCFIFKLFLTDTFRRPLYLPAIIKACQAKCV